MNILLEIENIVLESAITKVNARWWIWMKTKNEIIYQITMNYIKQLLENEIISLEEYNQLNEEFINKYNPIVSKLFYEISQ